MNKAIWDQLKNLTAKELCKALNRDGWNLATSGGSMRSFTKGSKDVSIHFHSGKTYGPGLLKDILDDIGWNEADLKRLKQIK